VLQIEAAGCLCKLVGDETGHGIGGAEYAGRQPVTLPITMVTAMVSPRARPSERRTPANIPDRA
jgi:hypothetical protein